MAEARLTRSEKRALALWVLFGALGLLFAQRYFFRAFPEASIDFKVSQKDAANRAKKFLGDLGENVSDYKSSVVFEVDDNAKTYLERELGLQQANRMMSSEVDVLVRSNALQVSRFAVSLRAHELVTLISFFEVSFVFVQQ